MIAKLFSAIILLVFGVNCIIISRGKGKYGKMLIEGAVDTKLKSGLYKNESRKDAEKQIKFVVGVVGTFLTILGIFAFFICIFNNGEPIIIRP